MRWVVVIDNYHNKNPREYLCDALVCLCKYDIKFHSFRNKKKELHIIIDCSFFDIYRIRKLLLLHLPIIRISKYTSCSYLH